MNKLDKMYRKARLSMEAKSAYELFLLNLIEIETWYSKCKEAFASGSDLQLSDRKAYCDFVMEMDSKYNYKEGFNGYSAKNGDHDRN